MFLDEIKSTSLARANSLVFLPNLLEVMKQGLISLEFSFFS